MVSKQLMLPCRTMALPAGGSCKNQNPLCSERSNVSNPMSALDIERLRSQRLQEKQEKEIHAMLKVDVYAAIISIICFLAIAPA